jgi:hypothetical protein
MHEGFTIGLALHEDEFPVIIIDNFVSKENYPHVKEEIAYLSKFAKGSPKDAGAATDADGNLLKKGSSLWFREFYAAPVYSPVMQSFFALLGNVELRKKISSYHKEMHWWGLASAENKGGFILNKYEEGDYYDYHKDESMYSAIAYFQDDDSYEGGELIIEYPNTEKDKRLFEVKDNRMIIFPSHYRHSVVPIKNAKSPRFSVAAFVRHLAT